MHDEFYPERSMLLLPMKRELSMGIKGQYGSVDRKFWFIKVQKCAHSRGTTVHTITSFVIIFKQSKMFLFATK